MATSNKEVKQRYFDKVYRNSSIVKCSCGCGKEMHSKDRHGRDKMFISGHNGRKYQDPKQYQKEWRQRNKKTLYDKKIKRGHDLKRRVIILLGGKCQRCGLKYDGKNACVFQLHHRNPKDKTIYINARTLISLS